MNSHYDPDQPGQYSSPRPHVPPPKHKIPRWAKIVAVAVAIPVGVIGVCLPILVGAGMANTVADQADKAPVVSADPTPTPTPVAAPTTDTPRELGPDERFFAAVRKQFPVLESVQDSTLKAIATSACDVLNGDGNWSDVMEVIGDAAPGYNDELAGMVKIGVSVYCPKQQSKLQPGGKKPGPSYLPEDGTLLVGKDVKPGTYQTRATGGSCYWSRLDRDDEIIDNGLSTTPGAKMTVRVRATDYALEVRCGGATWKKVG